MSSHHIVKEKQEPALFIQDLGKFDLEFLGQLLEWSPSVFVGDAAYELVSSLGIKIDYLIAENTIENLQENTQYIKIDPTKLDLVLNYLVKNEYPAVNVIGHGKRFDDIYPFLSQINVVLFTATQKTYPIKPHFKFWKAKGTLLEIEVIKYFETTNLRPLENGLLEVIEDGFVEVNFSGDYLFLSEFLN